MEEVTSDFVYLRLHGDVELYTSGYSDKSLKWWSKRVKCWVEGSEPKNSMRITTDKIVSRKRDAYIYFDNDAKVFAPFNAQDFKKFFDQL
jgi:uncharacterized protein YecE (DUF72 family)